jgi:hypothetical protein
MHFDTGDYTGFKVLNVSTRLDGIGRFGVTNSLNTTEPQLLLRFNMTAAVNILEAMTCQSECKLWRNIEIWYGTGTRDGILIESRDFEENSLGRVAG